MSNLARYVDSSRIVPDVELKDYTTFRVGGPAEIMVTVNTEEELENVLGALKEEGLVDLVVEDLGGIHLARKLGFRIHGGQGLNILNTLALAEYDAMNLTDATVSFELAASKIKKLGTTLKRGILAYGYLPLMHMRSCPARTKDGCKGCTGKTPMTDRKGETFTVLCREKQYADLLNCVPLYVADKPEIPVDFETLYFTVETPDEAVNVLKDYLAKQAPEFRRTTGLYWRELL